MAYIPGNARWYLAEVVIEHTVADDPRNVVHINMHLTEAASPELAYEKANALGRNCEQVFTNTDGKEVRVVFRGLRELNVIHDDLEDGAELTYDEAIAVPEIKLAGWLSAKEQLAVFRKRESGFSRGTPNLVAKSVMRALEDAGFDRDTM